jgi:hypothetical protein
MADEKLSHFVVPSELIHSDAIRVRGRNRPFTRPNYSAHGDFLRERAAALREYAAKASDTDATGSLFVQLKTPPDFPVEKERGRLKAAGFEIVALSPMDPSSGTAHIEKRKLQSLERKLETYATTPTHRGRSYLSIIEDVQPVPAAEKLSPELATATDEPVDCLLLFYSTLTDIEQARVLQAVRSFLTRVEAQVGSSRRFSNGVLAVEARLRPSQALLAGEAFTTLRQIKPDHVYYVPDSWRLSPIPPDIEVAAPTGRTAVAVFDTGIDSSCRELAGCIQGVLPFLPSGAVAPSNEHGTFVGSRIAYGDRLMECLRQRRLSPRTPLIDVPVFGLDAHGQLVPVHEGHLAAAVDLVVPKLPDSARVLNLSVGTNTSIVDGQISVVAALLDHHAKQHDVVVVTTAGNIRDSSLLASFPNAHLGDRTRIDSPGDSLHAITVGSIAYQAGPLSLSRPRELSAFSRRGPGPFGGIKPDVVAHGGNCHADGTTTDQSGVHGLLNLGRGWAVDFGTSFAAPLVSSMAAALIDHYERPSANLVKALLLHFTKPALAPSIAIPQEHLVGRGEPDLDAAMWATPHSATFICTGELAPSRFTYVPFHVPACLAAGTKSRLRVRATVVIDPSVAGDNPMEYCQARLTLALRKPADVGYSRVAGVELGPEPGKWSPVEYLEKSFSRSYSHGRWELQVRLWTRNLPDTYVQPFAAVIQVLDETSAAPVLSEVDATAGREFRHAIVHVAA